MVVFFYFGLFGCGKIILLVVKVFVGVCCCWYKYVYFNVYVIIFGVIFIDNKCVGLYNFCDCFIFIDEGIFFVDFCYYKEFFKYVCEYFMLYCYYNVDIIIFI